MTVNVTEQTNICIIQIDDGAKNVINHDVLDELESAFTKAENNDSKAILFMGREGSFCAGYDISVMTGGDADASAQLGKRGGRIAQRIFGSDKPIVGFSQGHAFTIGAVWLACCDLSIGEAGKYKYGMTEVALNVPLNGWALAPMRAKIKPYHQTEALLHSKVYSPDGALEAGFLDQLTEAHEGLSTATAATEALAALPPFAYKATKKALRGEILDLMKRALNLDQ